MTLVENLGRLEIVSALPGDQTGRESIMNIRPTASDPQVYDIGLAIANLLNDTLSDKRLVDRKERSGPFPTVFELRKA